MKIIVKCLVWYQIHRGAHTVSAPFLPFATHFHQGHRAMGSVGRGKSEANANNQMWHPKSNQNLITLHSNTNQIGNIKKKKNLIVINPDLFFNLFLIGG